MLGVGHTIEDLFRLVECAPEDGPMLGEVDLHQHRAMHLGERYGVSSRIVGLARKHGRSGTFDAMTVENLVVDDLGRRVSVVRNVFVCPRDRSAADGRIRSSRELPDRSRTASPGMRIPPWRTGPVSAAEMRIMALFLQDPNPIHYDAAAVRALGRGTSEINQGPTNIAYLINALLSFGGTGTDALRRLSVRLEANSYAGDHLEAGGRVTGMSSDRDGATLAFCDVWLDRADGARLISGTSCVALASPRSPTVA